VVVHMYNLNYVGGRGRRNEVWGWSWTKSVRPFLKNKASSNPSTTKKKF
jgi:hypothetical protein